MSTTPRTDAAWAASFSPERANFSVRDECEKLETELAAAKAERDLAITRVASILWSGAIDKHTCGDVQKWVDDYTAELARLRAVVAEVEGQTSATLLEMQKTNARLRAEVEQTKDYVFWKDTAKTRAENLERASEQMLTYEQTIARLRAENDEMRVQIEANKRKGGGCQCADDEACAHVRRAERAEAEVERLKKQIKDDNRSYGCELRDPNGTIWEQAAKDHAEVERLKKQIRDDNLGYACEL